MKLLLFSISISALLLGCTVNPPPVFWKNGRPYGATGDNTYIEDWDSCYRRGLSYSRGGYWEEAAFQFLQAIKERPKDQWRARTYGMNVLDEYFPHRELGIVYLRQGEVDKAIEELSLSLKTADSGKTKYYLNKARQQWLIEGGWDERPPLIQFFHQSIDDPRVIFTNRSQYNLRGRVEDDFFVASIYINGIPYYYELAQPAISFQETTPLAVGMNTVTCQAIDLMGREAIEELKVYLDRQGPLVFFSPLSDSKVSEEEKGEGKVKGIVMDDGGLDKLIVGRINIPIKSGAKVHTFDFDLLALNNTLSFQAEDVAGNITKGNLSWLKGKQKKLVRICRNDPYLPLSYNKRARRRLSIELIDCPEVVFHPRMVIQGAVKSPVEIRELWVNERPVFTEEKPACLIANVRRVWESIWEGADTTFYFTYLHEQLHQGKNRLTIWAEDKEGNSVQKDIIVEYRFREIEKIGNRWRLAIFPFDQYETDKPVFVSSALDSLASFNDLLWYCFDQSKRFLMVERELLAEIMREKKLHIYYNDNEIKKKDFIKMGQPLSVEIFLTGGMRVDWDGANRLLEITGRLVDGETGELLDTKNVYNRWKTRQDEEYLLKGLVHKFIEEFPLARGKVTEKNGEELTLTLGSRDMIKKGMKIVLFRQKEGEEMILGEAKLTEVYEKFSRALPAKEMLLGKIRVGDCAITK